MQLIPSLLHKPIIILIFGSTNYETPKKIFRKMQDLENAALFRSWRPKNSASKFPLGFRNLHFEMWKGEVWNRREHN
jgi:hypothetical protein